MEPVVSLAALAPEEFRRWKDASSGTHIPENLLEALQMETAGMQKTGWSKPPGSRSVVYQRPDDDSFFAPAPAQSRVLVFSNAPTPPGFSYGALPFPGSKTRSESGN